MKLVSTFHAKKSNNEAFHLLIIATHHDLVERDRVETLNDELSSLLLPMFQNELILFQPPKRIAFTLNLKNPDNHDQEVLHNMIRSIVGRSHLGGKLSSFIFFNLLKMKIVRPCTSVNTKKIGEEIKMSGEMVEAGLWSSFITRTHSCTSDMSVQIMSSSIPLTLSMKSFVILIMKWVVVNSKVYVHCLLVNSRMELLQKDYLFVEKNSQMRVAHVRYSIGAQILAELISHRRHKQSVYLPQEGTGRAFSPNS